MSSTQDIRNLLDKHEREVEKLIEEARLEGFEQGLAAHVKSPSDAQFRKDHKEPRDYGEEFAVVVYARSLEAAKKLLECDPDYVEEIGVGWGAFEYEGGLQVGYKVGRGVTPLWMGYGYYA